MGGLQEKHFEKPNAAIFRNIAQQIEAHQRSSATGRTLVGIAGIPGAGKTTVAKQLVFFLENEAKQRGKNIQNSDIANIVIVPLDGFHYTRQQLDVMPNASEAHRRRGAAWTFDAEGFYKLVRRIKQGAGETIFAPSFDHAIKDPTEGAIEISGASRVIVFEGNYLFVNDPPWDSIGDSMDIRLFMDVDKQTARSRLIERHLITGVEADSAQAERRVDGSDLLNADYILSHLRTDIQALHFE